MGDDRLDIECIPVGQLYEFACDYLEKAKGQSIAPISRHRALAHSRNPYAKPEDPGLFVAFHGNKCVGYQGVLPGRLWTGDQLTRVHWSTALFVLPEYRKRLIALRFVKQLMALKEDLAVSGFGGMAARFLPKMGFREIEPVSYYLIDLARMDVMSLASRLIQRRFGDQTRVSRALQTPFTVLGKVAYPIPRKLILGRFSRWAEEHLEDYSVREVDQIESFDEPRLSDPCFVRGLTAVNWMLRFPWVRDDLAPTRPPYHFSDVLEKFRYVAVEVSKGTNPGFLVMSVARRNGRTTLKLCDYGLSQEIEAELPFWICLRYAARFSVDQIMLPTGVCGPVEHLSGVRRLASLQRRRFLCFPNNSDKPLESVMDRIQARLWDGDGPFT